MTNFAKWYNSSLFYVGIAGATLGIATDNKTLTSIGAGVAITAPFTEPPLNASSKLIEPAVGLVISGTTLLTSVADLANSLAGVTEDVVGGVADAASRTLSFYQKVKGFFGM